MELSRGLWVHDRLCSLTPFAVSETSQNAFKSPVPRNFGSFPDACSFILVNTPLPLNRKVLLRDWVKWITVPVPDPLPGTRLLSAPLPVLWHGEHGHLRVPCSYNAVETRLAGRRGVTSPSFSLSSVTFYTRFIIH